MLDVGVAVGGNGHGLVDGGIQSDGLLPVIGHAVAIGIDRRHAAIDDAIAVVAQTGLGLGGVESAIGAHGAGAGAGGAMAEGFHLAHHQVIHLIVRQGAGGRDALPKGGGGGVKGDIRDDG